MAKRCLKTAYVVKQGDWIEIYSGEDEFLTSFQVRSNMCKIQLDRYVVMYLDIPATDYKIKKIGGR